MSSDDYLRMELSAFVSKEYGNEVLGVCRVPLYVMENNYHGLPAFLDNKFAGNAKDQLIESLVALDIMSIDEVENAQSCSRRGP